jgi:hypothetical protein
MNRGGKVRGISWLQLAIVAVPPVFAFAAGYLFGYLFVTAISTLFSPSPTASLLISDQLYWIAVLATTLLTAATALLIRFVMSPE